MSRAWYLNRLRRIGFREIAGRLRDSAIKLTWRKKQGRRIRILTTTPVAPFTIVACTAPPESAAAAKLIGHAESILAGKIAIFGRAVDLPRSNEDWFRDPDTGIFAPARVYTFDIATRDPAVVGNLKFLLESSRLQHVTVLAAAYWLTGRNEFAEAAATQLQSWWNANPFLTGVHWTSGIEVGLRLVSFVWTRRLLAGWPHAATLFENSELAREQIYHHQQYLASLPSRGSSANNHLIAELVGLYVSATAFPWFGISSRWAESAARRLAAEAKLQTFGDGISREQASEYHGFVLELFMVAAVEALAVEQSFDPSFHVIIARMADAWAAMLDVQLRPPRQGDSDDAYALLLGPPDRGRRGASLLAAAATLVGSSPWWPQVKPDIRSTLFAALCGERAKTTNGRPSRRPNLFPDAGMALLRDLESRPDELWCRCDHGPHGYLSIAAHAHTDALSIELRHGGIDVLADPGTYCYMTEPGIRRYFRSTIGHNTLELGGKDQARYWGPFLWADAPKTYLVAIEGLDEGRIARWVARTEAYAHYRGHPVHERSVLFDRVKRRLEIEDNLLGTGRFPVRLTYHFGPEIESVLSSSSVTLRWFSDDRMWRAHLVLPPSLTWRSFRGSEKPVFGWYSPAFGVRLPSFTLVGVGTIECGIPLHTILEIDSTGEETRFEPTNE